MKKIDIEEFNKKKLDKAIELLAEKINEIIEWIKINHGV